MNIIKDTNYIHIQHHWILFEDALNMNKTFLYCVSLIIVSYKFEEK